MVNLTKNSLRAESKINNIKNEENLAQNKEEKKVEFFDKIFSNKKKKVETESVKNYNEAIKTIKFFIKIYEFDKAIKSINEIEDKERQSYRELIKIIDAEPETNDILLKEKSKIINKYKKKQIGIDKLLDLYRKKKDSYKINIEKQRFNIRFKKIKNEANHLAKSGKSNSALKLLGNFLEEHPGNKFVIDFYNKEKKFILKQIEKEKEKEDKKLKQNAKIEALKLIGEKVDTKLLEKEKNEKKKEDSFIKKLKEKLNLYKKIKKNIQKKKLVDEINLLIEEDDRMKSEVASAKLGNIHKGLIKDISRENLIGYDLYGKILGADKISGDTFGLNESKKKYTFFIGDATGHGIKAGFIITLLTRLFNQLVEKNSFKKLIFEINNGLKQDIKSMNFITGIFFEIFKEKPDEINFIGLGHEPILIYRDKTKEIEKVIPGGLAAGIRIIKDENSIKVNNIKMQKNDILITYSDGIVESKSTKGEFYSIQKLSDTLQKVASLEKDIRKIYDYIINDVKFFRGGSKFDDDLTLMIIKRDTEKDKIQDKEEFLREIGEINSISKKDIKKIKGDTKKDIKKELEKIKQENYLKTIVKQLEQLWLTGEILKLKSEAKRYIKEGYIHPKINYYLKKAIENGQKYKIALKEERIRNKYNVMKEILKKGDYMTVIKEAEDIISKDGNI